MRRVVAYELVSLNGVAEDPDHFILDWDEIMDANLAEVIATQDSVILGRTSFDEWAAFWPGSDIEPFSAFINGVTKYVATSTPLAAEWTRSSAVEGHLSDFVRSLASEAGGDIGVHASISVVQHLLKAGQIDVLRLVIAPCVVPTGRKLFDSVGTVRLSLLRARSTPSGHLLVDYEVLR